MLAPMVRNRTSLFLLLLLLLGASCAFSDMNGAGDDSDSGSGTGDGAPSVDGDADGDADADVDADVDADADSDPTAASEDEYGANARNGLCSNGYDDDSDGLNDCFDFGCRTSASCCEQVDGASVLGDLTECVDLESCGWTAFATEEDGDAVVLEGGALVLGGDGVGEAGVSSPPVLSFAGAPTFSFVLSLTPASCSVEGGCRQAMGVALADGQPPSVGTGVEPLAGIVLDGELQAAHLYVGGRLEHSVDLSLGQLTRPLIYSMHTDSSGVVSFWTGRESSEEGSGLAPGGDPEYVSRARVEPLTEGLRIVAFGRLEGDAAGRVHTFEVLHGVCDIPGGWVRQADSATVAQPAGLGRIGSLSLLDVGEALHIIFEGDNQLFTMTSHDGGATFDPPVPTLTEDAPTQYGLVARRGPTVVDLGEDALPRFHMWFEAEAEVGSAVPAGIIPTAIVHAFSEDGVSWYEPGDDHVVEATDEKPFRHHVSEPTVALRSDGSLSLWYVGRDLTSGESRIFAAASPEGTDWDEYLAPITIDESEAGDLEADEIGAPFVIERGGVLHLWYTRRRGASSTIAHAVAGSEHGFLSIGSVLEGTAAWERGRVDGAQVVVHPQADSSIDILEIWYVGGSPGNQGIGVATRSVPTLL